MLIREEVDIRYKDTVTIKTNLLIKTKLSTNQCTRIIFNNKVKNISLSINFE